LFWKSNEEQRLYILLQFVILGWLSAISDRNYNKPEPVQVKLAHKSKQGKNNMYSNSYNVEI
jgi:hypothetical protein